VRGCLEVGTGHREVEDCYRIDLFCVTAALGKGSFILISCVSFVLHQKASSALLLVTICYCLLGLIWGLM
jgi:hypothetical protein